MRLASPLTMLSLDLSSPCAGDASVLSVEERNDRKEGDMPESNNSSLKDLELYEALRDDGASKQKAARISNAAAKKGRSAIGRKGGKAGDYDDWTVAKLRGRAKEIGLTGYSGKRKSELIDALRNS